MKLTDVVEAALLASIACVFYAESTASAEPPAPAPAAPSSTAAMSTAAMCVGQEPEAGATGR